MGWTRRSAVARKPPARTKGLTKVHRGVVEVQRHGVGHLASRGGVVFGRARGRRGDEHGVKRGVVGVGPVDELAHSVGGGVRAKHSLGLVDGGRRTDDGDPRGSERRCPRGGRAPSTRPRTRQNAGPRGMEGPWWSWRARETALARRDLRAPSRIDRRRRYCGSFAASIFPRWCHKRRPRRCRLAYPHRDARMWTVARLASAPRVDHRPRGCSRPRASARASSNASAGPTSADAVVFNAYDVLGVDVTASSRAVRLAFRAKAKDAHPDRGGTAAAFEELTRAHDILTDDAARALDAQLLDVPADGLTLEELHGVASSRDWRRRRTLARFAAPRMFSSARARTPPPSAPSRPSPRRSARRRTDEPRPRRRRNSKTRNAQAIVAARIASHGLRGTDARATLTITPEMLADDAAFEGGARAVPLEVTVERNCPRCLGWGEKDGHWTAAVDKLCPKCSVSGESPSRRR